MKLRAAFLGSLFATSLATLAAAEPRETALLRLTAMVKTDFDKGAGIIIGQGPGTLYLVTARHVIQKCSESSACVVQVLFQRGNRDLQYSDEWHPAKVVRIPAAEKLYQKDGDRYDIACLVVENVGNVGPINFDVKRNARPGASNDTLHAEGYVGGVKWSVTESARIATSSTRLQFGSMHNYDGASGGAIFNQDDELIGMAQTVDGNIGAVAGIGTEQIEELLKSVPPDLVHVNWDFVKPVLPVRGVPEARLELRAPRGAPGVEYRVPGDLSGVPMGYFQLNVSKPGYVPASTDITRRADVVQRIEYRLVRERFPWAAVSAATGGAAVLAGLVLGALALKQHSDFNANPSSASLGSVEHLNTAADVLFATGSALVATGVILHFTLPSSTVKIVEN